MRLLHTGAIAAGLLAVAGLVASGCGYRVVRYGTGMGGLQSVSVRTLSNESFEPGLEYMVSEALRKEFLRRGALRLADRPDSADLVLSGSVLPLRVNPRSFSSVVLALEYEVTLSLALDARRSDGSTLPLGPRTLSESETYLASADVEALRKNREEALRRVASVLAGRIHDALQEELAP